MSLVYAARDDKDSVIYVGKSSRPWPARWRDHERERRPFVNLTTRVDIEAVADMETAAARESVLIGEHRPQFNIVDNPDHSPERRWAVTRARLEAAAAELAAEARARASRPPPPEWRAGTSVVGCRLPDDVPHNC
jgi:excinuclease UvrABC nuclease subunit